MPDGTVKKPDTLLERVKKTADSLHTPDQIEYEYAVMGRERDSVDRRRFYDFLDTGGDGAPLCWQEADDRLRRHYSTSDYRAYVAVREVGAWRRAKVGLEKDA